MVGMVETTLKLYGNSSRLTAYGPDEDGIRVVEGAADGLRPTDGRKEK